MTGNRSEGFVRLALAAVAAIVVTLTAKPAHAQPTLDLPNIVLILADDLGIGDCAAYNRGSKIPTPNIDRIAAEGVRFLDAHAAASVCTPSRYALLTGEYAWRTRLKQGVFDGYSRSLLGGKTTIAELLAEHGYATACVGKWHLGLGEFDPARPDEPVDYSETLDAGPHTEGFEYSFIIPASLDMPPYLYVENGAVVEAATQRVEGSASKRSGGEGFWRAGPIAPGFEFDEVLPTMADRAVEWLREAGQDDRPFFLYFPAPAPHTPWVATDEYQGTSEAGPYGDFVAQLDGVVGDVIEALEATGSLDDTLLIFTSDNGAHWLPSDIERYSHMSNNQFRGQKGDIYDGGHRVPFLVRWPGHGEPRTISRALVGLQDCFATIGEVIGAQPEQLEGARDSTSFLPALEGDEGTRQILVHHSLDGMFAVRAGRWKLIEGLGSGGFTEPRRVEPRAGVSVQLYDMGVGPNEDRNAYQYRPELIERLQELLDQARDQ